MALLISAARADAIIDESLQTYKWIGRFAIAFAVKGRSSRFSAIPDKMGIIDESVET